MNTTTSVASQLLADGSHDLRHNRKLGKKEATLTEQISSREAHTNTRKLNWNVSTITDVFLNQKKVNLCEYMVKMAPCGLWRAMKG